MDPVPQQVDTYRIIGRLGSGSCATVWLARDEGLDWMVALKVLDSAWTRNDVARRHFMDEARLLRRLEHERFVSVYEVDQLEDGRPYFVMEYADRGSLFHRLKQQSDADRPFLLREAVRLGGEIAEGLVAAHDLGVVHCDLKPGNVLFRGVPPERQEAMRKDGLPVVTERVLLGDLGIAHHVGSSGPRREVLGTPAYMSPEQMDPATASGIDFRTDVYSAAVILYELLTGRLPFPYQSLPDMLRATRQERPVPVAALRPDAPARLGHAIDQALSLDPLARHPSAREWRSALRAAFD